MAEVYFTADLHLGHRLVAGLRGYPSTDEHDAALMARWCERVRPADHIWVLGDLNLGNPLGALDLLARLPGRKHLVFGNHDKGHPMFRDAFKWQRHYLAVFDTVQSVARRRIAGRSVLLSHFPYTADRGETRYPQWRLPDLGDWLLHGHTHATERSSGPRQIHVGLDAWELTPVPLEHLAALIAARDARAAVARGLQ